MSLSFFQSAVAPSQQLQLQVGIGLPFPRLQRVQLLVVEAKAKTRQEDRIARHSRIRKKVQ